MTKSASTDNNMKCKLTQTQGKGVNAHIIPRSFYSIDPDEKQPGKLITDATGGYPRRCPIGIYDDTIVTEEGERVFSAWDDYATELLIQEKSFFEPISHRGKIAAYQIPEYNYGKLKLFFLSVLWRASVSKQHFFRKVGLGPHEPRIREALLEGDPKEADWFGVIIAKWSDFPDGPGMMDPYRTKFDGINYYVMYLEHYIVYYKVDRRIPAQHFRSTQLKPDSPLIAIGRDLKSSQELKIIGDMVRNGF